MKTEKTEQNLDVRLRERALRNGGLTRQELQAYFKSLPDEAKKSEEIPVYEEPSEETTVPDDTRSDEPTFFPAG